MKFIFSTFLVAFFTLVGCDRRPIITEPCIVLSHGEWRTVGNAEPGTTPRLSLSGKVILPDAGYEPFLVEEKYEPSGDVKILAIALQFRGPINPPNANLVVEPVNPFETNVAFSKKGMHPRVRVTCGQQVLWESVVQYGL